MKRFRLTITDKFEDRPRLLTAYGRLTGGEIGFVLRPLEHTALLVHLTKDGAHLWENAEGKVSAAWPRALAQVRKSTLRTSAVVMGGELDGRGFYLREGDDGEQVSVAIDVANKVAHRIVGDGPRRPDQPISSKDAVARIRNAQKSPPKRGPATFRGQWTGALVCDDGQPRVELQRKLATYGWLRIHSGADGWHWRFERQAKWFTEDAVNEGGPYASLVQAIDAGVAGGLGLVRQACGIRDTTRKTLVEEPPLPGPVGPEERRSTRTGSTRHQSGDESTASKRGKGTTTRNAKHPTGSKGEKEPVLAGASATRPRIGDGSTPTASKRGKGTTTPSGKEPLAAQVSATRPRSGDGLKPSTRSRGGTAPSSAGSGRTSVAKASRRSTASATRPRSGSGSPTSSRSNRAVDPVELVIEAPAAELDHDAALLSAFARALDQALAA